MQQVVGEFTLEIYNDVTLSKSPSLIRVTRNIMFFLQNLLTLLALNPFRPGICLWHSLLTSSYDMNYFEKDGITERMTKRCPICRADRSFYEICRINGMEEFLTKMSCYINGDDSDDYDPFAFPWLNTAHFECAYSNPPNHHVFLYTYLNSYVYSCHGSIQWAHLILSW